MEISRSKKTKTSPTKPTNTNKNKETKSDSAFDEEPQQPFNFDLSDSFGAADPKIVEDSPVIITEDIMLGLVEAIDFQRQKQREEKEQGDQEEKQETMGSSTQRSKSDSSLFQHSQWSSAFSSTSRLFETASQTTRNSSGLRNEARDLISEFIAQTRAKAFLVPPAPHHQLKEEKMDDYDSASPSPEPRTQSQAFFDTWGASQMVLHRDRSKVRLIRRFLNGTKVEIEKLLRDLKNGDTPRESITQEASPDTKSPIKQEVVSAPEQQKVKKKELGVNQ